MTSTATRVHALTVETVQVDDVRQLIPLLDTQHPLLWSRGGDGLAGVGEAARLEFTGAERLSDAADAWRALAAEAHVIDPLGLPGTGLVAFGAFSFSASSALPSVLVVPELLIGRRDGICWVTRVRVEGREASGGLRERLADALKASALVPEPQPFGDAPHVTFTEGALSETGYLAAVRDAIERLTHGGPVHKVVLARDVIARMPADADLRVALAELALAYPDCWTYSVDGLLGASPETLVRVHDGSVSSRVLAGTVARGADDSADAAAQSALAASAKDHDEHAYAVGSVLDALGPHCEELDSSAQPFTLELPNLWHLATDVCGRLADGSSSLDLVTALHPTAAVAGTPTDAALRLIEELEPFDRARYAGPVGWVDASGDGEWAIALRGAEVSDATDGTRELRAFAGCGIVDHSVPELELAESTVKLRPIVEAFG